MSDFSVPYLILVAFSVVALLSAISTFVVLPSRQWLKLGAVLAAWLFFVAVVSSLFSLRIPMFSVVQLLPGITLFGCLYTSRWRLVLGFVFVSTVVGTCITYDSCVSSGKYVFATSSNHAELAIIRSFNIKLAVIEFDHPMELDNKAIRELSDRLDLPRTLERILTVRHFDGGPLITLTGIKRVRKLEVYELRAVRLDQTWRVQYVAK